MSSVADKLASKSRPSSGKVAMLGLVRIGPWSALVVSLVMSAGLSVVGFIAFLVLWGVLGAAGVFNGIDKAVTSVSGSSTIHLQAFFGFGSALTVAVLALILNTLIGTALGTIGAALYNLSVRITRGVIIGFGRQ